MEKKITKQYTGTINIIIYADNQQNAQNIAQSLAATIDANPKREYAFKSYDFETALTKKNKFAENKLAIVATADLTIETVKQLINRLDRKGANYIVAESSEDTFADYCATLLNNVEKALQLGFSISDYTQIHEKGICLEKIKHQITIFRDGITKISLKKPAVINDGIFKLPKKSAEEYAEYFDKKKDNYKLMKFIPASGAATRMFKFLNEFMADFNPEEDTLNAYVNRKNANELNVFLVGLEKFAFFNDIAEAVRKAPEYNEWSKSTRAYNFIRTMLQDGNFDFANKPKGILPFHKYEDHVATPVCEHFKESIGYAVSQNKTNLHFTISEEHLNGFLDAVKEAKDAVERTTDAEINFSFSYQHKSTDTLAVDMENKPFREDDGSILFRPGGHGALIENLNELDADIVFIKNIDNVSHNNIELISLYKKALAGGLIELQEQVFIFLERIDEGGITEEEVNEIFTFAKEQLSQHIPSDVHKFTTENKVEYARQLLNRPIRVCGMVKNEGEPGGGPFWVEEEKGRLSLQIVESSQIDMDNKNQKQIFSQSTHFNPVDLVCGLKDYKGNKFNLTQYVDNATGFIVQKNRLGKDVKSYELPGLWNGAMAGWITVFVEVPLETFNPVKTVNDLLKPAHQPQ